MRRRSKFNKTEVTRAVKAVRAAGEQIARVEIGKDGTITVVPGRAGETPDTPEDLKKLL